MVRKQTPKVRKPTNTVSIIGGNSLGEILNLPEELREPPRSEFRKIKDVFDRIQNFHIDFKEMLEPAFQSASRKGTADNQPNQPSSARKAPVIARPVRAASAKKPPARYLTDLDHERAYSPIKPLRMAAPKTPEPAAKHQQKLEEAAKRKEEILQQKQERLARQNEDRLARVKLNNKAKEEKVREAQKRIHNRLEQVRKFQEHQHHEAQTPPRTPNHTGGFGARLANPQEFVTPGRLAVPPKKQRESTPRKQRPETRKLLNELDRSEEMASRMMDSEDEEDENMDSVDKYLHDEVGSSTVEQTVTLKSNTESTIGKEVDATNDEPLSANEDEEVDLVEETNITYTTEEVRTQDAFQEPPPSLPKPQKRTLSASRIPVPTPRRIQSRDSSPHSSDNYDINDLSSKDSTDDESQPRKAVPKWAHYSELQKAMAANRAKGITVDKIADSFGAIKKPNLEELFPGTRTKYGPSLDETTAWDSPVSAPRVAPLKLRQH